MSISISYVNLLSSCVDIASLFFIITDTIYTNLCKFIHTVKALPAG